MEFHEIISAVLSSSLRSNYPEFRVYVHENELLIESGRICGTRIAGIFQVRFGVLVVDFYRPMMVAFDRLCRLDTVYSKSFDLSNPNIDIVMYCQTGVDLVCKAWLLRAEREKRHAHRNANRVRARILAELLEKSNA